MTRAGGVGSLAHEWGHALDNFLDDFKGFHSDSSRNQAKADSGPVASAMREVHQVMAQSGYRNRLGDHLREMRKTGLMSRKESEYYLSPIEMFARTFERHIQHKLHGKGRENTYLVGLRKEGHPVWPTDAEAAKIAPAMEKLFESIKDKHYQGQAAAYSERLRALSRFSETAVADLKATFGERWGQLELADLEACADGYQP